MTAVQRFALMLLLFIMIAILGVLFLLITDTVVPPAFGLTSCVRLTPICKGEGLGVRGEGRSPSLQQGGPGLVLFPPSLQGRGRGIGYTAPTRLKSAPAMRANDTTLSLPSRLIITTPRVARPACLIACTRVRKITPPLEMMLRSSPSCTTRAAMIGPVCFNAF